MLRINCDGKVNARVDRLFGAVIKLSVALYAHVVDHDSCVFLQRNATSVDIAVDHVAVCIGNDHAKAMGLIVKFLRSRTNKLDIHRGRQDHNRTNDGYSVVHFIAEVGNKGDLHERADTKSIFGRIRIGGVKTHDKLAVGINAKEQVVDQACYSIVLGDQCFIIEGGSTQIDAIQEIAAKDAVCLGIVPI